MKLTVACLVAWAAVIMIVWIFQKVCETIYTALK